MQWTAPDAYTGEVGDPMSEQPYMWDRNNPASYFDPSGFDWVLLIARPADLGGGRSFGQYHSFIEIYDDNGKLIARLSAGPSDDKHPLGSTLIGKDSTYDQKYSGLSGGSLANQATGVTLCQTVGKCTLENGGFDEAGAIAAHNEASQAHDIYGVLNSCHILYLHRWHERSSLRLGCAEAREATSRLASRGGTKGRPASIV